ncbi:PREDICTED: purple acid phosphatase 22-like [Nicotiana attenuata]|uniref:Purple acid phosphatase n=1 Tax=Nicotiana attenuata TaxID=49451 RepID=A0A1J6I913_NICAT|nr:PREDICTED: purple acid phosphatase 22-like [Nicotiana attenuata]OIT01493.1 purple acid phosphatase 22 [Nicotiana attenuata]
MNFCYVPIKMAKYSSLLFFFLLLNSLQYFHASPEYSRPHPRPVILTGHNRPETEPEQVHISLVGNDHMRVTWITSDKHAKSIVEYGTSPGNYQSSSMTGERTSYRYFFYSSGEIHHVTIGPLEPNTTYYYRCGGSGPEFSFKTPPSTFPIEFAVAGDLGQTEWTASTLQHIGGKDYDVLLLPGDLSYADTQQPLWDSFGRLVEPYASKRPWMVTQGNHEIEIFPIIYPHGFKAYNSRWLMPYQESSSTSNLYYSFNVVGCHVVMLGSYTDFDADSDQYKWLQADLAKVDRVKTPWIFALIHAPWYNSNAAHKGEGESMRKSMEEVLYKARVDVVFAGHVHAYERFTRVYNNKADPCGPIYVTIGDGGNREGLAMMFEKPSPSISVFREASFGHGRLKIYNETHAHWSWHRNNDKNSVMADELWLQSFASSKSCCKQEIKTQKDEL